MTTPDKIDKDLRTLRTQVRELERRWEHATRQARFAAAAAGLAGAMLALTMTTWSSRAGRDPRNLWQLADDNRIALGALVLVLVLGASTLVTVPGMIVHRGLAVVAVLAAVCVLLIGIDADPEHTGSAGRWLTLLITLALAGVHSGWAERAD